MDRVQKQLAFQLAILLIAAVGVSDPENAKLAKKTAVGLAKELRVPNPSRMPLHLRLLQHGAHVAALEASHRRRTSSAARCRG
jgi:hypothetical protein